MDSWAKSYKAKTPTDPTQQLHGGTLKHNWTRKILLSSEAEQYEWIIVPLK